MLDIQLGPPGDPRPGAPDVRREGRGEGPGQDHGSQHLPHQGHPRRRGPSARARDSARRAAWLQKNHYEQQDPPAEQNIEISPDTETVAANPTASSNELVEQLEAETEDSELSDVIPQLDGPAEETTTSAEETMEEDSENTDLSHLPTADDPERLDEYIKHLDQEKIENMSKQEIAHINAQLARKIALRNKTEQENEEPKKKHTKSKKSRK